MSTSRIIRSPALTALLLAATLAAALAAVPHKISNKAAPGFTFQDWNLRTDLFTIRLGGDFSVPRPLTLTRPGSSITADRANGNQKRKFAVLYGHVVMHDSGGIITSFAGQSHKGRPLPATLTCNELQIDGAKKVYVAIGNVHFSQGGSTATTDRAILNGATHELELHGNVHVHFSQ